MEESKIEELSIYIADELFYTVKNAIKYIKPIKRDVDNKDIWSTERILKLPRYINAYVSTCYYLYRDTRYLEEAVSELSKPYKWIVQNWEGKLINLPTCGNYPAVEKRNKFIQTIQKIKPDYKPPTVSEERFGTIVWEEEIDKNEKIAPIDEFEITWEK